MKTLILFCVFCLSLISCGDKTNTAREASVEEEKATKEKVVTEKEVVYNKSCVIIYSPDSLEMIELQKKKSQEEIVAIDYDKTLAMEFLSEKDIPVFIKNDRYYKFIKANGEEITLDKTTYQNWGIILFKPEKEPKFIFINSIMEEYDIYFNE